MIYISFLGVTLQLGDSSACSALALGNKMLNSARSRLHSPNRQEGINVVDLMIWLVVAALLMAAAIQGIGYYMQATYVYHARSDLAGAHQWVAAASALNSKLPTSDDMKASLANNDLSLTTAGGNTNIGLFASKSQTYCVGIKSLNISDLTRNVFYSTSDDPNNVIRGTKMPSDCGSLVAFAPIGVDTSSAVAPASAPAVTGTVANPTTANFVWDAIPGASGYKVESKINTGAWTVVSESHPSTSINVVGSETQEISVRVTAINSAGESPVSNAAKVNLPATTPVGYAAWGGNTSSQLNIGTAVDTPAPAEVLRSGGLADKKITKVETGNGFSCALAEQKVYCWGVDNYGQLGNGAAAASTVPGEITTTALAGKTITALSVGVHHACVIAGGEAYCWGHNGFGKLGQGNATGTFASPIAVDPALLGSSVTFIDAGSNGTCAVSGGKAYCWGYNQYKQIGDGSTVSTITRPTAVNTSGYLSGKTVTSVHSGGVHSCALAEGKAYCWGSQSASGTPENSSLPVPVDTTGALAGKTVTALGTGDQHSCAVADNSTYCWGGNSKYQMGNNTSTSVPNYQLPVGNDIYGIFFNRQITSLSVGYDHSCVVASGKAYCWGYNTTGQIGQGDMLATSNIKEVVSTGALAGKTVVSVDAGTYGTFAGYSNNTLPILTRPAATAPDYLVAGVWGENVDNKLNIASAGNATAPVEFLSSGALAGKRISQMESANGHTCAIADGEIYCWGDNVVGQLGTRGTTDLAVPTKIFMDGWLRGKVITDISVGNNNTCAVADGKAYCWGGNGFGQTGNSLSGFDFKAPVPVYDGGVLRGKTVTDIDTGGNTTCAIADGKPYCWGYNTEGELGNGDDSGTRSHYPVEVVTSGVLSGKTSTSISTGTWHTCVIADGKPYCWGYNAYMELGNGSRAESSSPVAVNVSGALNGKTVSSIGVGIYHSCVIADLRSYCWGYNAGGQSGWGSTSVWTSAPTGTNAAGLMHNKNVTSLAVGGNHTCAIADGKTYCWGQNAEGELGNGTTSGSATPVLVTDNGVLSGKSQTVLWTGLWNTFVAY